MLVTIIVLLLLNSIQLGFNVSFKRDADYWHSKAIELQYPVSDECEEDVGLIKENLPLADVDNSKLGW